MEASHHSLPWTLPFGDAEELDDRNFADADLIDSANLSQENLLTPSTPSSADLQSALNSNGVGFSFDGQEPLDCVPDIDDLGGLPSILEQTPSPASSSSTACWTPSSGQMSATTSSQTTFESPCESPGLLMAKSPGAHPNPLTDIAQNFPACQYRIQGTDAIKARATELCTIMATGGPQPNQASTTPRELTMQGKPPGVPARAWRQRIRPVICPECGMGFDYQRNLTSAPSLTQGSPTCKNIRP
ncbi:hypothetical protein VTI74DRAFT_3549 [Chaetomium olivicolor]